MGERERELYGLERSLDNSLMVVFGDEVVVAATNNDAAMDDVVATVDVAAVDGVGIGVGVGATAALVVWVQWCWMRP